MEEEKQLSEKLNCIRNEMTHLWGSVFIIGGGSVSLFLHGTSLKDSLAAIIGAILTIILAYAYFIRREETLRIVKKN
ncbi:MAG: hypothetical protein OSJ27_06520 [Candidatus Gastranaerophilales bacterium]|nr:hypothetical protein [Candidatus Gastranaerophilales bacterium]